MVERGDGPGLVLEAAAAIGVSGEAGRQDLDSDDAIEAGVPRLVHLAHAAGPNGGEDLGTDPSGHRSRGA